MVPTTLFTIGYEDHPTPESLVAALQGAGVRRLVDVRELPNSRRRGFSKKALAAALEQGGIAYEHARALGNPHRDLYRAGRFAQGEAAYRRHLTEPEGQAALAHLQETLDTPTSLLCLEASPKHCHRTLVAQALAERLPGLAVVELR
jgi:uncharacterized protein (DUF488 family)